MADYLIASDEQGAYELPLTPDTPITVETQGVGNSIAGSVQVTVHEAASPVYVRRGTNVATRDPRAIMVPSSTWVDVLLGKSNARTIAIVSASPAVVSVARA